MYRVAWKDFEIKCDSPEAVAALLELMSGKNGLISSASPTKGERKDEPTQDHRKNVEVKLLRAIVGAYPEEISAELLVEKLELKNGRALGAVAMLLRKSLKRLKVDADEVFSTKRVAGKRYWLAKERAREILKTLEK